MAAWMTIVSAQEDDVHDFVGKRKGKLAMPWPSACENAGNSDLGERLARRRTGLVLLGCADLLRGCYWA